MSLSIPEKVPELGFYYHFKHDPNGPVNGMAYEVVGVGFNTEDNARPGEEHYLLYRPLYEGVVYETAKKLGMPCFYSRPLKMWMEEVEREGRKFPRFQKINDPEVIEKLTEIRNKMYV